MARRPRARRAGGNGNRRPAPSRSQPRRRRTNRSASSNILAQSALSAPAKAFGASSRVNHLSAWDAFSPSHLPLPRVTGPYCVVRTTKMFQSSAEYVQFGTWMHNQPHDVDHLDQRRWSNCVAMCCDGANAIYGTSQNKKVIPMPGIGDSVTAVPSALSVQIMNPEALQTTAGIVAAGTYKTQVNLTEIADGNNTKTYNDLADDFVSFQAPRLMSAGKLALKGVQINSYPLNMSELANFTTIDESVDYVHDPSTGEFSPVGFVPICVVNKDSVALQYLVTMEWRVRFDPSNPAVAAHRYHGHCDDATYAKFVQHRTALGHGVYDIADGSARSGAPRGEKTVLIG